MRTKKTQHSEPLEIFLTARQRRRLRCVQTVWPEFDVRKFITNMLLAVTKAAATAAKRGGGGKRHV